MVFQPRLPEVISGSIGLLDTITPIRPLCPSTNLSTRTVASVDLQHRRVSSTAGFGSRRHHLHDDHLVLALGNVTSVAGLPGLAERGGRRTAARRRCAGSAAGSASARSRW